MLHSVVMSVEVHQGEARRNAASNVEQIEYFNTMGVVLRMDGGAGARGRRERREQ